MMERIPPISAVINWLIPIVVKNIFGKDTVLIKKITTKYKNPALNILPRTIPKILFLTLLTVKQYIPLEIIMNGIRYTRNIVTLPNSKPLIYAIQEGNTRKGIVFLKPNLRVEYINIVLTKVPTSNWGFPMKRGISNNRRKREEYSIRNEFSVRIFRYFLLFLSVNILIYLCWLVFTFFLLRFISFIPLLVFSYIYIKSLFLSFVCFKN